MSSESLVKRRKYDCLSRVHDNVPFSNLSLIGTNESFSFYRKVSKRHRHQSWDLSEQIYQGVRVFELTLAWLNNDIVITYGRHVIREFDSFMKELNQYMRYLHPKECFFLILKRSNDFPFEMSASHILDTLYSKYQTCVLYDENKKLSELRGKVWILNFFDLNHISMSFVQDKQVTGMDSGIKAKIANCKNQLKSENKQSCVRIVNFQGSGIKFYNPLVNYKSFAKRLSDSEIYDIPKDVPAIFMFDFPEMFVSEGYDFIEVLMSRNYNLTY